MEWTLLGLVVTGVTTAIGIISLRQTTGPAIFPGDCKDHVKSAAVAAISLVLSGISGTLTYFMIFPPMK